MASGIMTGVLVLFACSMFLLRRIKNRRFQKWNHRAHKMFGILALMITCVHLMKIWWLRFQRPIEMYVWGSITMLLLIVLVCSYYFRQIIGKKWKLIHRIAAVGVIVCMIIHVSIGMSSLQTYKKQVNDIEIHTVDLTKVPDGVYVGEENVGYIYCKVKVSVSKNRITEIDILKHRTERGKAAEILTDVIVQKQNTRVDAVSGATNSSKVIMKAVENALENSSSANNG